MGKKTAAAAAAKMAGNRNIGGVHNNGTISRKNSTAQGRNIILQSKADETLGADNSSEEEPQFSTTAAESPNADASDSSDSEEEDGAEFRTRDETEDEPPPTKVVNRKGKKIRVEDDNDDEEGDEPEKKKRDSVLYRFPMNRVKSIIKEEIPDLRISPEAVFLINRASEKFLQLFSKEAYACAFLDRKNHISYHHLSSIVTKRKRFSFLSDFVPEMLKAEDAEK